jgi:hypothetical protein
MPAVQFVLPGIGWLHTPSVPLPIVHTPPQHSASWAHASPSCTQYDDGPHVWPELQNCEQQSVAAMHGLPSVLHVALSGAHLLPEQLPLQQSLLPLHEALSAMHAWLEHTLLSQRTEQQSVFALHEDPGIEHVVGLTEQLPVESHTPEQHEAPAEHGAPNTPHGLLASTLLPFFLLLPQAVTSATRQTESHQVVLMTDIVLDPLSHVHYLWRTEWDTGAGSSSMSGSGWPAALLTSFG